MITVWAPDGVGEVRGGDDLADLVLTALEAPLVDGDVVVVTSKAVSKAEGRARASTREAELPGQTLRVVARRGPTTIVRNLLGLTMAAAGIDASNVAAGTVLLLPVDPDATARRIRAAIGERTGTNVGVVVTDTAGRAWRDGQTDLAIGAAGLTVLQSFAGRTDAHGNPLVVTAPAVADEIASAAELAQGKLAGRPFAVVRGRADLVLPAGEDGPGAATLVRPEGADLFGYGAREAVVRALAGRPEDRTPFGAAGSRDELAEAVLTVTGQAPSPDGAALVVTGAEPATLAALAFAFGWTLETTPTELAGHARLLPPTP
ncbi:coenzyme F420-0:L-glutamate ligase / coenzyme F420-1:gamma-L-glutamate ligase [Nocardioides terrae]|uniref:Coenzyme F420-0:L-glutamate ligase / coenzyme F420-1:gamma-L-glutamate ligase n=1 Tax=Nocardioides terrae TaxID=574651 RepID=A0A1I1DMB5_9ACTN|nr:coenzyme F420-0:L-glutamate ligase [Nocardioides terrae]SFB75512.1 coenzyme F420-0:L-glutamate ligase / coenzyme F420-1:gamma-L-glutamate ligase [Nocardioides terrae]